MEKRKVRLAIKAKVWFASWILQTVFVLWIFLLFVVFAKMDYGNGDLFPKSAETESAEAVYVLPERLISPNPPTE